MTLSVPFSLELAAGVANAARRLRYQAKKNDPGYNGPVILAEGDSWFCYPIEFPLTPPGSPRDIIHWLLDEFAILNVAVPGALAKQYRDQFYGMDDGNGGLHSELLTHKPAILLLSGGGNDLLGDLEAHIPGGDLPIDGYLKGGFQNVLTGIIDDLEWVARKSVETLPDQELAIIFNGYDKALPGAGGDWLLGPMTRLGIPAAKHRKIVNRMISVFNKQLSNMVKRLHSEFGGPASRFAIANTVGVSGDGHWYNEIHPDTEGFNRVAKQFRKAILKAVPLIT